MIKEMTMVKEFKEFNCFITLYSQTLGLVTVEYDERSLNKLSGKQSRTNL